MAVKDLDLDQTNSMLNPVIVVAFRDKLMNIRMNTRISKTISMTQHIIVNIKHFYSYSFFYSNWESR